MSLTVSTCSVLAVLTTVVLDAESPVVRDVLLVLVVLVMLMLLLGLTKF